MAINFTTTRTSATHVKALVYGRSGSGKTTLCRTAPKPIIISTENKLLALRKDNIPVIEISTTEDLSEAIKFIKSKEAKKYQTVCVDSITDIAESLLSDLKSKYADPRRAYGDLADIVGQSIRDLRDIKKKHLYCIAKAKRVMDENVEKYQAYMPGTQLLLNLPYFFDFVLPLRIEEDDDGTFRYLQTQPDYKWDAKDSSGNLDEKERPNLKHLFKKALSD